MEKCWENRGGWWRFGCWTAHIVAYVYQQSHVVSLWHQHCSLASCWLLRRNQRSVILTFVLPALGYQQQEPLFYWMLLLLLEWVVLLPWVLWLSAILVSQESIWDSCMCLYLFSEWLKLLVHCVILHVLHVSAVLAVCHQVDFTKKRGNICRGVCESQATCDCSHCCASHKQGTYL